MTQVERRRAGQQEAAAFLDVSRTTLHRLMESGAVPFVWVGCRRKIAWQTLHDIASGKTDLRSNPRKRSPGR